MAHLMSSGVWRGLALVVSCSLTFACVTKRGVDMTADPPPVNSPEERLRAGRIALMALQVGLSNEPAVGYRLAPGTDTLTIEAAALLLAGISKPIHCEAALEGGITVVRCEAIRDEARLHAHKVTSELGLHGLVAMIRSWCQVEPADPMVQVLGAGETVTVPLSVVLAWRRDYGMRSGFDATPLFSNNGPCAAIALRNSGSFTATVEIQN